ncbi:hypothetical protein CO675_26765 [Bradyrhizobium sp. C9]|nr:hypothetical protein CO675_26765 [Bradyrhizobium sp. C9]
MKRRKFSREFKLGAVKLVRERGVSETLAGRDLDVHDNVLRKWVRSSAPTRCRPFLGWTDEAGATGDRTNDSVVRSPS